MVKEVPAHIYRSETDEIPMTLLEICHILHLSDTGQAKPLEQERRSELRAYLSKRMSEWVSNYTDDPRRIKFDFAVYRLCQAALMEGDHSAYVVV